MRIKTFLLLTIASALSPAVSSAQIVPPPVPANLEVPAGREPYLAIGAEGTQNYVCIASPSSGGFAWTFFGPQATLFLREGQQVATHYLSSNPVDGAARATWQHSADSSKVWAAAKASSSDGAFVAPGSIPWLLLEVVGEEPGPAGPGFFNGTTHIQRVLTSAGTAPIEGCKSAKDIGKKALVPYTTFYVFYR
ncbi:MAG TPA: DUF3455 domain-containing protein [Vicinamibacterales bacterium]|nr:DUF3455 domain-containing protein [Vicinamibacterales bacterium]